MIENYLKWIQHIKNLSPITVYIYKLRLDKFQRFLKKKNICSASIIDIENFITSLAEENTSINTRGSYLIVLKQFYKYARIHNYKVIPYEKIILPKKENIKIDSCTESEIKRLIHSVKKRKYKNDIDKKRNLAIIYTLLGTGLRVSELINIRVNDLGENLMIQGKGGKIRYVPFPLHYRRFLMDYINTRKIKSERCFCSHAYNWIGHKITRVSIEAIFRDISFYSGIRKTRPHKIRHTYATLLLRNGVSIFHISKLLGHSSIETTQKYLTCYNEDLDKAIKCLPKF